MIPQYTRKQYLIERFIIARGILRQLRQSLLMLAAQNGTLNISFGDGGTLLGTLESLNNVLAEGVNDQMYENYKVMPDDYPDLETLLKNIEECISYGNATQSQVERAMTERN